MLTSKFPRKKKKEGKTGNGRQNVTCFKCKPACLKHLFGSSDIMLKLEPAAEKMLSLVSSLQKSETTFETSQVMSP